MSEREEAAEAARAEGRKKALFEVIGGPLERNGRRMAIGTRFKLPRADAEILMVLGRIRPAKGKAKPDQPEIDDEDHRTADDSGQPPPTDSE